MSDWQCARTIKMLPNKRSSRTWSGVGFPRRRRSRADGWLKFGGVARRRWLLIQRLVYISQCFFDQLAGLVSSLLADGSHIDQSDDNGGKGKSETEQPINQEAHPIKRSLQRRLAEDDHYQWHDHANDAQAPTEKIRALPHLQK